MSEQTEQNKAFLKKHNLKITEPRMTILKLIQDNRDKQLHFTAEDVYKFLFEDDSDIGLATVYRVLNQFEEAGILIRHNFDPNKAVFELNDRDKHHHIICKSCGYIFEFEDPEIDARQREIGEKYGIALEQKSMYLYGNCQSEETCDHNDNK